MAFIDEIKLHITAGKGGDGVVRWRQEKFKPKAGPGGGNGGRGADVYAEAVQDLSYLNFYRHDTKFRAPNGGAGEGFGRHGANGEALTLKFPVGSIVRNKDTGEEIYLEKVGQRELLLRGGRGGLGNEHFKSSTNTTPYESTPGKLGQSADFEIELRLIADVGLVGLPSAGKSSLLNALTNAHSKVGAYHFTTLEPHLGVIGSPSGAFGKGGPGSVILADIPGLIEGASSGKGLGHKFLRHIQRTKVLAHLISLESDDIVRDYQQIRHELEKYDLELMQKKEVIILSKTDLLSPEELEERMKAIKVVAGDSVILTSSIEDEAGLKELSEYLTKMAGTKIQ